MPKLSRIDAGVFLLLLISSCGGEPSTSAAGQVNDDFTQWKLPHRLREISGLALTADERLFAITDETATVYELDYDEGRIIKSFTFGDPVVRADFEGIAVLEDRIWLMTSDGMLFVAAEGPDGQSVSYRTFDTGHGAYCELEGLAQDRDAKTLILACKETTAKKDGLMLFEWRASVEGIDFVREVALPQTAIIDSIDEKRINPSGVAVDPVSGEWVLVAARQNALIRLGADGLLLKTIILKKKRRHRQAEGIEMTRDGRMLIADEGDGGRARLAVYRTSVPGSQGNE